MKKIDKIYEKDFSSLKEMNKWIKDQEEDIMAINIVIEETHQSEMSGPYGGGYTLFYGKIKYES